MHTDPWQAPYATHPGQTRGRLYPVDPSPTRSEFQRDRDRILHSSAFRRLKHKTQVFVYHEGDHYRTRLTHSLEVAQIARSISRTLGLNEDLAEALALAHDLGHTPFGHTGEDALNACMKDVGGFDHNAQALRIVTRLEKRYADYDGLNLTWETLEGLVKHNGPLITTEGVPIGRYRANGVPMAILGYSAMHDLCLWSHAGGEAQAAAVADDIAYDAHDIDDGLRAGLFTLDDLREVPFLNDLLTDIFQRYPTLERSRAIHELMRRVITRFVEDVVGESLRRIQTAGPMHADDIRRYESPVIALSMPMERADQMIKAFLFTRMYRTSQILHVREQAERVVRRLFEAFTNDPQKMPDDWPKGLNENLYEKDDVQNEEKRKKDKSEKICRRVADYIAGMTDRYALQEYARLFGETPELRLG